MVNRAQRLLLGVALGCLVSGAIEPARAQCEAYSTLSPVPYALKEAVYPFTMPFTNLVQMTRWGWNDACASGGCGDPSCTKAGCGRPCCSCGPEGRLWARADYLLWWTAGGSVPPLVTTGSPNDPVPGALGQPNTEILFGDRAYNGDARHQYRFQLGYWLGDCRRWAIQGDWLDLGQSNADYSATSSGDPMLARPFYDVLRGVQAVEIIAYPDLAEGQVDVRVSNGFHSAGANVRRNLLCCSSDCGSCSACDANAGSCGASTPSCWRLDLIGGYRHYKLDDAVTIRERITLLQQSRGGFQAGTQFDVQDAFRSRNEFHGGEIGVIAQRFRGKWSFEAMAKLAMGSNRQVVTIDGRTVITVPNQAPVSHVGGLMALETTNIGTYQRNDFALIPQFNFEIGYQLTCRTRVYVGYDLLLWWNVARAGDHIDTRVNTSYLPPQTNTQPPALPAFAWQGTDFWAQGMNVGWEFRY